ncbi:MAG: antitoxin of toxin-antitoxin stability system [Pseudomonadota bacterium]|nr:antitoxin of toxin-antitoxin stability system [Pseudomonadota bacterium]
MLDIIATKTMSFKVPQAFAEETKVLAKATNKQVSEYIREAVREKNERELAGRIRMLSERLSVKSRSENKSMEGALGDGIA